MVAYTAAMVENSREAGRFTISRRQAMGGFAAGVGAAWAAPSILTLDAAGAASLVPLSPVALGGGVSNFFTADALGNWAYTSDGGDNWTDATTPPPFAPLLVSGPALLSCVCAVNSADSNVTIELICALFTFVACA